MDNELLINRIIAGCIRLKLKNDSTIYLFTKPTNYQKYIGEEIYHDLIYEYQLQGLFSEEELTDFMLDNGLWNSENEEKIEKIKKNIEELKIGVYQSFFKSVERKTIKKALDLTKIELNSLIDKKSSYSHMSAMGAASLAKNRYLFGCSLYYEDNSPVVKTENFWKEDSQLIEKLINVYYNQRISESKYRELTRNNIWRTYWGCRKAAQSVFFGNSIDLTEEQRNLISWTVLYDGIYECPDCPSDEIIEDDDATDGWLILQKRERDKTKNQKMIESLTGNDKINKSDEIFIPVNTPEDAKKIEELNADSAKAIKRRRDKLIKEKGVVAHDKLPDVKQDILMEANKQSMKGK